MRIIIFLFAFLCIYCCKDTKSTDLQNPLEVSEIKIDNTEVEDDSVTGSISTKDFREFKVLDSKNLSNAEIWEAINPQMEAFSEADYNRLKPLILENDIQSLQNQIAKEKFNYAELTMFYLYRIRKFDRENKRSLNSVLAINPNVISEALRLDEAQEDGVHPIYGMPILLKDNINAEGMATTAGAVVLKDNFTKDAFIVNQLKSKGALILGKANLSEWAYFFCDECPSGYSAIGGQTLNPYGRRTLDTGGSSSGSGVAVAANFCVAAIGSETSGSILSPASQNSVVGLKPTIGLVSRSGIVPISSTLDTAGPITRTVMDNAIVLDAIFGEDSSDSKSIYAIWESGFYYNKLKEGSLKGTRFGALKRLLADSLYAGALEVLRNQGAEVVEIDEEQLGLPNFLKLLSLDMKKDLPLYLENYANPSISVRTVPDIIDFNRKDSIMNMPYGQGLFNGIALDKGDAEYLERIKDTLKQNGKLYFDKPMNTNNLDAFLSINNMHAGQAAVAEYPAITVPMGYTENGEPKGLTFISKRLHEKQLLEWAYAYEQASKARISPKNYD